MGLNVLFHVLFLAKMRRLQICQLKIVVSFTESWFFIKLDSLSCKDLVSLAKEGRKIATAIILDASSSAHLTLQKNTRTPTPHLNIQKPKY